MNYYSQNEHNKVGEGVGKIWKYIKVTTVAIREYIYFGRSMLPMHYSKKPLTIPKPAVTSSNQLFLQLKSVSTVLARHFGTIYYIGSDF